MRGEQLDEIDALFLLLSPHSDRNRDDRILAYDAAHALARLLLERGRTVVLEPFSPNDAYADQQPGPGPPGTRARCGALLREVVDLDAPPIPHFAYHWEGRMTSAARPDTTVKHPEQMVRALGEWCVAVLAEQGWLDRPSYRLEHALAMATAACGGAGERVSNLLHGTWLGHPLHPLLTSLPTGALATTLALDVAGVLPAQGPAFRAAAQFSLGVAVVGSVSAGVTGLHDWQHTQEQPRRVGLVHGALNTAATGLYVVSWLERGRGRHRRGVSASTLGFGLTLASGYLGASLVYRWGIGVDRSGRRLGSRQWAPLLAAAALEAGAPQRVEVAGVGLVLFRDGDTVLAVGEHCPHLGAPMADGWLDRGRIVCPWHGSRFEPATGRVVRGPATAPLPCYQTRVQDEMIEVRGGTPAAPDITNGAGG